MEMSQQMLFGSYDISKYLFFKIYYHTCLTDCKKNLVVYKFCVTSQMYKPRKLSRGLNNSLEIFVGYSLCRFQIPIKEVLILSHIYMLVTTAELNHSFLFITKMSIYQFNSKYKKMEKAKVMYLIPHQLENYFHLCI